MGQIEDLKKARKARARKRAIRHFIVLIFLFIIIFIFYLLFDKIKDFDIKTRVNDIMISMGTGPGYPTAISGREPIKFYQVSGMPAILNDSNNYVYNTKGKTISNIPHGFNIPVAEAKNGKILLYDLGGQRLQIHSLSKKIIDLEFDQSIINADISESGSFAVATSSDNYVGEVSVFNEKGKNVYIWSSAHNVITDISISPKGDYLAVATINAQSGDAFSCLYIFKIDTQTYKKIEFKNEYPLSVKFRKNNEVTFITDKSIKSFTNSGRSIGSYDFSDKILVNFYDENINTALVLSEHGKKSEFIIVQLNNKCEALSEYKLNKEVFDIITDEKGCCIACEDSTIFIDIGGEVTDTVDTPWIKKLMVTGDRLYYTTHDEIYKINGVKRNQQQKGVNSNA